MKSKENRCPKCGSTEKEAFLVGCYQIPCYEWHGPSPDARPRPLTREQVKRCVDRAAVYRQLSQDERMDILVRLLNESLHLARVSMSELKTANMERSDWCDICKAPQMVMSDGEHRCGEPPIPVERQCPHGYAWGDCVKCPPANPSKCPTCGSPERNDRWYVRGISCDVCCDSVWHATAEGVSYIIPENKS